MTRAHAKVCHPSVSLGSFPHFQSYLLNLCKNIPGATLRPNPVRFSTRSTEVRIPTRHRSDGLPLRCIPTMPNRERFLLDKRVGSHPPMTN
jgi:hypothetical protein